MGGSGPSNTWFLGPTRNGITIGSATFAQLTVVTDRQTYAGPTDHANLSVAIGRIKILDEQLVS